MNGNEYQRKHMGVVFQNYNLLEYLTVYDNIEIAMDIKGMSREKQEPRIRWLLSRVGLDESMKDRKVNTLSGGEQQMLAISRALMGRPRLLLLDEPSLGLAPIVIRQIFSIIQKVNADGMTVFLVEQNANQALRIAHRGYVMENGRIVMADKADALLTCPEVRSAYLGM